MDLEYAHQQDGGNLDVTNKGNIRRRSSAVLTPEEAELAKLGYKQEFKREFSWMSTFSFAFSISGLLATVLSALAVFNDR
jgi:hypothetical protein